MSKYKVGDELRIREWDDMADEFGLDDEGHINCKFSFAKWMRPMCGKDFTVRNILIDGSFRSIEDVEHRAGGDIIFPNICLSPEPKNHCMLLQTMN